MKRSPSARGCQHHTSQRTMCFLRCRKCQICTYDFEFGINKLYLRHIRPHYHSHTAARSLLMFVPHGSVGVMAFFVPPSLIGQCYSKLLMWSGCFDVVFTSWYLCPLGHADIWILFCRLHGPKNNNFIKHLIRNALHFHIFLPE